MGRRRCCCCCAAECPLPYLTSWPGAAGDPLPAPWQSVGSANPLELSGDGGVVTSAAPTGVGLLDLAGCCSGAQCWIASALFPTALSVWLLGFASHDTDPLTAGYGVLNFGGPLFAYVGNAVFPWDGGAAPAAADGDTITVLLCGDDITLEINGAPAATATGVGLPAGVDHLALVADTTPAFYDLAVSCGL